VMSEQATVVAVEDPPVQDRCSVVELFAAGSRLVGENADLPSPFRLCDIHPSTGQLCFQLAPEPASVPALVAWGERFGGVLQAGDAVSMTGEPYRWVRVQFPYGGVQVLLWTHLPLPEPLPFDSPNNQAE
jgi:hypothetical protein